MNGTQLLPIRQNTGLVTYALRINGAEVPETVMLRSISVYREANRIPTARLVVVDGDASSSNWDASSGDYFVPGNEIEILAGYHRDNDAIFKGIVTKQSIRLRRQHLEMEVECKDLAVKMTLSSKCRQFEDKKDSDVIEEIIAEYGISGSITATPVTHAKMMQYQSSDWDFMISRLDANGMVCLVQDGEINCIKPELAVTAIATLRLGSNLLQFDTSIDGRRQPQKVVARSWDPAEQAMQESEATDPAWATAGNFDPDTLAAAVGAAQYDLLHAGHLDPEALQGWADACLLRRRMAFLTGKAQVQGFATAIPGTTVALEGLGDRYTGNVWVSGVRHEISQGNWLTDLQLGLSESWHLESIGNLASNSNLLLPPIQGLHIAVVTQLADDPEGENRIRIKIPTIDPNDDGVWARMASLDAGDTRGMFFLPEIDDEVIVGFLGSDPREPVVLGMLHSSAKPAPLTASDDNHEKGYQSRSGIKFLFNDDKKTVSLETPGGNSLLLDDDGGTIVLADQHGNKITLSSDGIVMESAKDLVLKAAAGLEAKAGAQFKAEGTGGFEAKSSGNTVIKGSMVQIN